MDKNTKLNSTIDKIVFESNKLKSHIEPLHIVIENANKSNGLYLEFGVAWGEKISFVAKTLPNWDIYGFDSFEGLPEFWRDGYDQGKFSLGGNLPKLDEKINLVKGLFNDSIPIWLNNNKFKKIDIIHFDCDLYSSTKTVFYFLSNLIDYNTIMVFDEILLYPGFENHEIKALAEFIIENNYDFEVIASGGSNGEKLAIKLKSN